MFLRDCAQESLDSAAPASERPRRGGDDGQDNDEEAAGEAQGGDSAQESSATCERDGDDPDDDYVIVPGREVGEFVGAMAPHSPPDGPRAAAGARGDAPRGRKK